MAYRLIVLTLACACAVPQLALAETLQDAISAVDRAVTLAMFETRDQERHRELLALLSSARESEALDWSVEDIAEAFAERPRVKDIARMASVGEFGLRAYVFGESWGRSGALGLLRPAYATVGMAGHQRTRHPPPLAVAGRRSRRRVRRLGRSQGGVRRRPERAPAGQPPVPARAAGVLIVLGRTGPRCSPPAIRDAPSTSARATAGWTTWAMAVAGS